LQQITLLKVALFFGSFNPVHIGHLAIANFIVEYGGVDELWFVVSPQNPLKDAKSLAKEYHRAEMLRLAVENYTKFKVSEIEFKLPKPSFTAHTMMHLTDKFPDKRFSLIIGSDNLLTFHKWKNYEWLLDNFEILVYPRKGTDETIFEKYPQVKKILAPEIEISSSEIRKAVKSGIDLRYYMHPESYRFMTEMNLYK
jgi:nicotinate-nucleotide adenylyltransferase